MLIQKLITTTEMFIYKLVNEHGIEQDDYGVLTSRTNHNYGSQKIDFIKEAHQIIIFGMGVNK